MISQLDDMLLLTAAKFTDWHVDINKPESSVVFASQNDEGGELAEAKPMRVPEMLMPVLSHIIGTLKDHREAGDQPAFAFDLGEMRFRGQRMRPGRYALRRARAKVDPLRGLGLGAGCEQVLLDPEFRSGGLVLICGEHGAGKSTTARSAIVERLKTYGGYCQTVEAPIEVDFEGFHGDGYLEQIDATIRATRTKLRPPCVSFQRPHAACSISAKYLARTPLPNSRDLCHAETSFSQRSTQSLPKTAFACWSRLPNAVARRMRAN